MQYLLVYKVLGMIHPSVATILWLGSVVDLFLGGGQTLPLIQAEHSHVDICELSLVGSGWWAAFCGLALSGGIRMAGSHRLVLSCGIRMVGAHGLVLSCGIRMVEPLGLVLSDGIRIVGAHGGLVLTFGIRIAGLVWTGSQWWDPDSGEGVWTGSRPNPSAKTARVVGGWGW